MEDRSGKLGPADDSAADDGWERRTIESVVAALHARLGPSFDAEKIKAEVEAEFASFHGARVRDFVPVLVETRLRRRLSGPGA